MQVLSVVIGAGKIISTNVEMRSRKYLEFFGAANDILSFYSVLSEECVLCMFIRVQVLRSLHLLIVTVFRKLIVKQDQYYSQWGVQEGVVDRSSALPPSPPPDGIVKKNFFNMTIFSWLFMNTIV